MTRASPKGVRQRPSRSRSRRAAERRGRRAEAIAAMLYQLRGFRICARRYATKSGEIDLIAKRRRLLVFVEVKARADLASGVDAVTPAARRRIEAAGDWFLARTPTAAQCAVRYDIAVVSGWRVRQLIDAWRRGD